MEQKEVNRRMPYNSWSFVIVLTIALGLAPLMSEPHLWGKIRWIAGGAVGMKLIDWGDFLMHGALAFPRDNLNPDLFLPDL
mgnify:CR=1 FL=1